MILCRDAKLIPEDVIPYLCEGEGAYHACCAACRVPCLFRAIGTRTAVGYELHMGTLYVDCP